MDRLHRLLDREMTKREFLDLCGKFGLGAAGLSMLPACISTPDAQTEESGDPSLEERTAVHYPQTRYPTQIQSPEHYGLEGCMTGYWNGFEVYPGKRDPYSANGIDVNRFNIGKKIDRYTEEVGRTPSIVYLGYYYTRIKHGVFDTGEASACAEKGVIPFITFDLRINKGQGKRVLKMPYSLNEIIESKADEHIKNFAKQAREFGEQYGGFFIRTMREMNLRYWPWGLQPNKFKKVWNHIGDIFDGEGVFEAGGTMVFDVYSVFWSGPSDPNFERYYPGDKYVYWVGINAYSHDSSETFKRMLRHNLKKMHKLYPHKPLMIEEYGIENIKAKPKYVRDAFQRVKHEHPEVKAFLWWDQDWRSSPGGVDSRIDSSPEALQAFKESIADPYFLEKVPYREG